MNVILLGPPGSGKGTQGALLAEQLGVPRIATGELLRGAVKRGTPLGQQAASYMNRGQLVPDEVILGLIDEVLGSPPARSGVIMDGFPRTVAQAEAVDRCLAERDGQVDHVVSIDVAEDELVRRLGARAGREGRSDDTAQTIRQRLAVYEAQTAPLTHYYRDRGLLRVVDGMGSVESIAQRIAEVLT